MGVWVSQIRLKGTADEARLPCPTVCIDIPREAVASNLAGDGTFVSSYAFGAPLKDFLAD